jgi:hypothetical protein
MTHRTAPPAHAEPSRSLNAAPRVRRDPDAFRRAAGALARRPGRPLHTAQRTRAESSFGHSLRDVRIHTDRDAARMADAAGVRAFTFGLNIAFGTGAWTPGSSTGDKRIAHELAHAAQQRGAVPRRPFRLSSRSEERDADAAAAAVLEGRSYDPVAAPLAFAAEDGPTATELPEVELLNPYGEPSDEQLQQVEDAKQAMLAALERYDSIAFLSRLRSLSAAVRIALDNDADFHEAVRKHLRGKSYWIVQLRLRFGNAQPQYIRQLSLAMLSKDGRTAADLLRAYPELRNPHVVPGVYDALDHEFRDHPWRPTLLRIAREKETARALQSYSSREVHFEQKKGGGGWELQTFNVLALYDLARTASELRVVVRMHLVEKDDPKTTYWPEDATLKAWRNSIESVWNNRYAANNGTQRLRIVFVPVFSSSKPHFTVRIVRSKEYYRSSETEWWEKISPATVAHEFGHMLGNPDEYRLPAKMSDVPESLGLSEEEKKKSTVEGVTGKAPKESPAKGTSLEGIMGREHDEGAHAKRRHVWPILDRYNRTLKPPEEKDYVLVGN